MYTEKELLAIKEFFAKGGKVTICKPYNKRPEPRKGPVYTLGRKAAWLPAAKDLNFDYSRN